MVKEPRNHQKCERKMVKELTNHQSKPKVKAKKHFDQAAQQLLTDEKGCRRNDHQI